MFLTVFRRENGMIYHEMPGMDIGASVHVSACRSDQARADAMDRVHMDLVGWSKDSASVLVELNARGEKGGCQGLFRDLWSSGEEGGVRSGEIQCGWI